MSIAREFLDRVVRPTVDAWLQSPLDGRLAKQAANELNNLAERVFRHWPAGAPEVYGAAKIGEYRRKLVEHAASDFQLVWDIADAHKHVELDRPSRQVSRDDQTSPGRLGYGEAKYGEGVYGGTEELVVRRDDGTRRPVSGIISSGRDGRRIIGAGGPVRLLGRWSDVRACRVLMRSGGVEPQSRV